MSRNKSYNNYLVLYWCWVFILFRNSRPGSSSRRALIYCQQCSDLCQCTQSCRTCCLTGVSVPCVHNPSSPPGWSVCSSSTPGRYQFILHITNDQHSEPVAVHGAAVKGTVHPKIIICSIIGSPSGHSGCRYVFNLV